MRGQGVFWRLGLLAVFMVGGGLGPVPARAQEEEEKPIWVITPEEEEERKPEEEPPTALPDATFLKLIITTTDRLRLAAWYLPPQDGSGGELLGTHPGVLVLPREGDTMADRAPLVSALARQGLAVLTFDHRGVGRSDPFDADPLALVYPQYLTDAYSALDILWRRPEVDTTKVGIYGESRGAYLAFAVVADRPEVRALVSVSVPQSMKEYRKVLAELRPGKDYYVPKSWPRRRDPTNVIDRFNGAILFIAGDMDLETPIWMSRELFQDYVRPKELWEVKGANHGPERGPLQVAGEAFAYRVAGFFHEQLAKKPHRGWPSR